MYQNYNYYQPSSQSQTRFGYINPLIKGHPVSSIEEAKAASIDFDGSVFYFPDVANKKIYTKQINADGTSSILMYGIEEIPPAPTSPEFVTKEEFNNTLTQIKTYLENLQVVEKKEEVPAVESKEKILKETAKQKEFKF